MYKLQVFLVILAISLPFSLAEWLSTKASSPSSGKSILTSQCSQLGGTIGSFNCENMHLRSETEELPGKYVVEISID